MVYYSPKKDPPVRKDGRCATCKKKRPVVAEKHGDPFCSVMCCRVYHGTGERDGQPEAAN